MKTLHHTLSIPLLVAGLLLTACNGGAATPAGNIPPVVVDDFAVSAEGRLAPLTFAQLSFSAGGKVAEVSVAEGDAVAQGDLIARLENSEALQAEVARAEAEVLSAQTALDDLNSGAALITAQAELAVANAREALDQAQRHLSGLKNPDVKYYQDRVKDAQGALTTAQENTVVLDIGSLQASLQAANDGLKAAGDRLGAIQTAIDSCATCDPNRAVTVDGYPQTLSDAQDAYNSTANTARSLEIQLAQAQRGNADAVEVAQKQLDDAQKNLNAALGAPNALKLQVAQATADLAAAALKDAEAIYAKVQSGLDPHQKALAEARLNTAKAARVAAQAAPARLELRAPFAGTVAALKVKVGEQAAPGQPVATVADFSSWMVETDNLTEIEVVKIKERQQATVGLDALPDVVLQGKVVAISSLFEEKRGDVTYTVKVALVEGHPLARWGMTAVVTFGR
ncbi:MAG: HlyD family efflux transporter periplasmic adaptor subunit [Chloroflexi bacterium]|nr:HlyD family efflux transporter periplasmic adaptor subunit [Chloroflexota bacterium]